MHYACDTEGDTQPDEKKFDIFVEELRGVARRLSTADSASLPKLCQSTRQRLLELVDRISESLVPEDGESNDLANDDERHSQSVPRPADAPLFNSHVRKVIHAQGPRARKEVF